MKILEELRVRAYATVCPRGRAVMLRVTKQEGDNIFSASCVYADLMSAGVRPYLRAVSCTVCVCPATGRSARQVRTDILRYDQ